jgi:hypothetical protein
MKKKSSKKITSNSKKRSTSSFFCDNMITRQNKTVQKTCKKIETKLKNKKFRKKLLIGTVIFLLFNLAIILMLSRKTIVYKLTKYFTMKILEGASPQEKELITNIQTHLPIVVDFVTKHSDNIQELDRNITYYSTMYNEFAGMFEVPEELKNSRMPGGFPINDVIPESSSKKDNVEIKKLNETEGKKLIDELLSSNAYFDNDSNITGGNLFTNIFNKLIL